MPREPKSGGQPVNLEFGLPLLGHQALGSKFYSIALCPKIFQHPRYSIQREMVVVEGHRQRPPTLIGIGEGNVGKCTFIYSDGRWVLASRRVWVGPIGQARCELLHVYFIGLAGHHVHKATSYHHPVYRLIPSNDRQRVEI